MDTLTIDTQSDILSEEQVNNIINDEPMNGITKEEEVVLPSETKEENAPTQEQLLEAYNKMKEAEKKVETTEVPANVVESFTKKYLENGGFTEADYKELAAKGYSKDFVDTYVQGVQAKEVQAFETELKPFGNMNDFNTAVQWAANTWSKEQIESFNKAISTTDAKTQAFIAGSLIKEMKMTSTTNTVNTNQPIHTNTAPRNVSNEGYSTKSEMVKDMNDPRYTTDNAYRARVEQKLIATDTKQWYVGLSRGD